VRIVLFNLFISYRLKIQSSTNKTVDITIYLQNLIFTSSLSDTSFYYVHHFQLCTSF